VSHPLLKITTREALLIAENIRAGRATVLGEARRLGVYHATLRKSLRLAVGRKQYDKLHGRKATAQRRRESSQQSTQLTRIAAQKMLVRFQNGATTLPQEAARLHIAGDVIRKAMVDMVGEAIADHLIHRPPSQRAQLVTRRLSEDPFRCKCGGAIKPTTDGNGRTLMQCWTCGHRELVIPKLATAGPIRPHRVG